MLQSEGIDTQRLKHRDQHVCAEVGVLEIAEGGEVTDHADGQQAEGDLLLACVHPCLDAQAEPVVPVGNRHEQQQKVGAPPGVEQVAAEHDDVGAPMVPGQVVAEQEDRQEQEQKDIGCEDHAGTVLGQ